jgi:hypothetical protein
MIDWCFPAQHVQPDMLLQLHTGEKSWMRKRPDYEYHKRNISVVICDTDTTILRDCKLVSVLMNIFQEAKWNWHRWSSSIRSTSEQQYAKWVYSWGTTRHIHIKRPTYSAQRNTVTFWRKSDLSNNEIVPCLPVIYKATECTALEHTMGNISILVTNNRSTSFAVVFVLGIQICTNHI